MGNCAEIRHSQRNVYSCSKSQLFTSRRDSDTNLRRHCRKQNGAWILRQKSLIKCSYPRPIAQRKAPSWGRSGAGRAKQILEQCCVRAACSWTWASLLVWNRHNIDLQKDVNTKEQIISSVTKFLLFTCRSTCMIFYDDVYIMDGQPDVSLGTPCRRDVILIFRLSGSIYNSFQRTSAWWLLLQQDHGQGLLKGMSHKRRKDGSPISFFYAVYSPDVYVQAREPDSSL